MERASERVLAALSSLHGTADWQEVVKWLQESADADQKTMLLTKDEVSLRWLQGSVQTLTSILGTSNDAAEIMHRKRQQK